MFCASIYLVIAAQATLLRLIYWNPFWRVQQIEAIVLYTWFLTFCECMSSSLKHWHLMKIWLIRMVTTIYFMTWLFDILPSHEPQQICIRWWLLLLFFKTFVSFQKLSFVLIGKTIYRWLLCVHVCVLFLALCFPLLVWKKKREKRNVQRMFYQK